MPDPTPITKDACDDCKRGIVDSILEVREQLCARIREINEALKDSQANLKALLAEYADIKGQFAALDRRLDGSSHETERRVERMDRRTDDQIARLEKRLGEQAAEQDRRLGTLADRLEKRLDETADRIDARCTKALETQAATAKAETSRLVALAWKAAPWIIALLLGGGGVTLLQGNDAAEIQKAASEAARKALIDVIRQTQGEAGSADSLLRLPPGPAPDDSE
jgi:DNA repair exonuclease SbcCD ATPase subunit